MALPSATRADVWRALDSFDIGLRPTSAWSNWRLNGNFEYEMFANDASYPVKQVVALATGEPTTAFSGGKQANDFIRRLGFKISRLRPRPIDRGTWTLRPGERVERKLIHDIYGGARQGGIEPSRQTPNVLLFSDPKAGAAFGYDFDGWKGEEFHYTGDGQVGDQGWRDGNKAILYHDEDGRALRLFDGARRTVTYLGEFELSKEQTFHYADARDRDGNTRQVIVFHLVAIDSVPPEKESPPIQLQVRPRVDDVPIEAHDVEFYDVRTEAQDRQATRREQALVKRYEAWLLKHGCVAGRKLIVPAGEVQPLYCDLYNQTRNVLVEAKASASRSSVRMAIGQLFDYTRFLPGTPARAFLAPERPRPDLEELLASAGVYCVWQEGTTFADNAGRDAPL